MYIQNKENGSLFIMEKEFNVTGSCNPQRHYMVDISHKFDEVVKLIGKGKYFTINRPRQYGKTTMLDELERHLPGEYLTVYISFEGIGDAIFNDENKFTFGLIELFSESLRMHQPGIADEIMKIGRDVSDLKSFGAFISQFVENVKKNIVVLIDEVDKSSNNQLFLSFLGMLRNKYLLRERGKDFTFQAVILAGVHDVKSLKLKIREDGETKLNSPWNIAADFNVDMSFNPAEIKTMLTSYAGENDVKMDFNAISERIYYYTNGYPFLVSKICKNIAEEEPGQNPGWNPKKWTLDDIDWSFRWLTRESYTTTNFDELVKNLENNPELYNLVYSILFNGTDKSISFSVKNPLVNQGIMYGMFKEEDGRTVIHNRIYEQILSDYIRSKQETAKPEQGFNGYALGCIDNSGFLQFKNALLKFQEFMKEHYSAKDSTFLEREGRLVFMSFLKPLINGKGFMWKEPVAGDERRMDIVVTYGNIQKEVVELKIWRGDEYHQQGLKQFSDYLDFQNLKHGYLLIFDFNKKKQYKSESIKFKGKAIFAVWV
jgi:hypothetical protein